MTTIHDTVTLGDIMISFTFDILLSIYMLINLSLFYYEMERERERDVVSVDVTFFLQRLRNNNLSCVWFCVRLCVCMCACLVVCVLVCVFLCMCALPPVFSYVCVYVHNIYMRAMCLYIYIRWIYDIIIRGNFPHCIFSTL